MPRNIAIIIHSRFDQETIFFLRKHIDLIGKTYELSMTLATTPLLTFRTFLETHNKNETKIGMNHSFHHRHASIAFEHTPQ